MLGCIGLPLDGSAIGVIDVKSIFIIFTDAPTAHAAVSVAGDGGAPDQAHGLNLLAQVGRNYAAQLGVVVIDELLGWT